MKFHTVHGDRITLSEDNTVAARNLGDFNNGIVFSSSPLQHNVLFEIRIEKKIYTWSGGLEFGVTECDPDLIEVPANATDLKNGTWILSGSSVLKDGRSLLDIYPLNLNTVEEGDVVGVMCTSESELVFSLNGYIKGVAAQNIPASVYAIIDLYGQVAQASIVTEQTNIHYSMISSSTTTTFPDMEENDTDSISARTSGLSDSSVYDGCSTVSSPCEIEPSYGSDKIRFHTKAASLVKVSFNGRAAERLRPLDEFNNGIVMTHRPLYNNELFEIRIDRLVEKWSGSIEVGVTTHNPEFLDFPPTMTNLKSGTIMMSGSGILTNGKATARDYGEFNLDDLMVGDRIGVVRKSNGTLHYIINGLDQGCAAANVPAVVWGVVDMYGRTVKVTVVDRDEREEQNLVTRRNTVLRNSMILSVVTDIPPDPDNGLTFHPKCGTHAAVTNNNRTAYRPNAYEDFNNAVVITERPLKRNEVFEVRIDKIVTKWAGSIEIGVTTHSATTMEYPSTMTNIRSGTWMMTGNGVMQNGVAIIDDYGVSLDKLQMGDRVAVVVKDGGVLHFFVNGSDQGVAALNLPNNLYGVVDLYGQAAQVTIVDCGLLCCCSTPNLDRSPLQNHTDLHFHHIHGKHARIANGGRTALRPYACAEFTDAVVISNRPIRSNEMFAVVIEKIVDRWSGSLEAGVTAIKPDDLEIPSTMTDLDHDTWMLSGSTVMCDGQIVKHGYPLNLDRVQIGMVVGIMRHNDGSLHFYLDGVDQGEAISNVPPAVYPVIDLYGQCAQVSIVSPAAGSTYRDNSDQLAVMKRREHVEGVDLEEEGTIIENGACIPNLFYSVCGKNVRLLDNKTTATRGVDHAHGIVFSDDVLEPDKLFEIRVSKWTGKYAGCLSIGVTTNRPERTPLSPTIADLQPDVWYLVGEEVWLNKRLLKARYSHHLHWLQHCSTIGVKVCSDNTLHFVINGKDQGVAATDIPQCVYAVIDIYGSTLEVQTVNESRNAMTVLSPLNHLMTSSRDSRMMTSSRDSCMFGVIYNITQDLKSCIKMDDLNEERLKIDRHLQMNDQSSHIYEENCLNSDVAQWSFFNELRGRNIRISNNGRTAVRCESYNQGVVIVSEPLPRETLFEITIEQLNPRWTSSLVIGVLCHPLKRSSLPVTAFGYRKGIWLIAGDSVFHNGTKVKSRYGPNLDNLTVGQRVGLMIDSSDNLRLYIDGEDQGIAAANIPLKCFVIVDLYGQIEQVSIVNAETECGSDTEMFSSVDRAEPDIEVVEIIDLTLCEKGDLELHEKESPLEEQTESHIKLNKTNENMLAASALGLASSLSNLQLDSKSKVSNEQSLGDECEQRSDTAAQTNAEKANGDFRHLNPFIFDNRSDSNKQISKCEYRRMCMQLRCHVAIPASFFGSDSSVTCFCRSCYFLSAQESKGEPPLVYSVPIGWCKFPIKHLTTNNIDYLSLEKWHIAFIGSSFKNIRRVLDTGQLHFAGAKNFLAAKKPRSKSGIDIENVVISPSIQYASSPGFSEILWYTDPRTKSCYKCLVAFQVLVRPGSYKAGPPPCEIADDAVSDTEPLEWVIEQKDAAVLSAMLFKMDLKEKCDSAG